MAQPNQKSGMQKRGPAGLGQQGPDPYAVLQSIKSITDNTIPAGTPERATVDANLDQLLMILKQCQRNEEQLQQQVSRGAAAGMTIGGLAFGLVLGFGVGRVTKKGA